MRGSRRPPAEVARALRQESGFGCVLCGKPFVEYHHIIPWEEEHHFRTEDMVAVCGDCHHRFHAMSRDKQYRCKKSPYNRRYTPHRGSLEVTSSLISFVIGSCRIVNCPKIIGFNGSDLFSWKVEDDEFKVSIHIQGPTGSTLLLIKDNEIVSELSGFWDMKFQYNRFKIWSRSRKVFADIDLRSNPAGFFFETYVSGVKVTIGKESIAIENRRHNISNSGSVFTSSQGYIFDFFSDAIGKSGGPTPGSAFSMRV